MRQSLRTRGCPKYLTMILFEQQLVLPADEAVCERPELLAAAAKARKAAIEAELAELKLSK